MKPPHVPWHEVAGLDPAALAANLATIRAEGTGTPTDKARAVWEHAFTSAARAGFDESRVMFAAGDPAPVAYTVNPRDVAAVELATAPKFRAPAPTPRRDPAAAPLHFDTDVLALLPDRIALVNDSHTGAAGYDDAFDATAGEALPDHHPDSANREEAAQAEAEFLADARAETGGGTSPEVYERQQKNRRTLREQSARIVEMLNAAGIQGTRDDSAALFVYWIHSKRFERLPAYRRICLIPEVASLVRAPKLAALEYWLERHPYARFWTFTTGERCTLEELPARLDWLNRKLRQLNKALKPLRAEIVFRSTEFGSLESEDSENSETGGRIEFENGEPLFHPHAHCVVHAKFGYNREKWAQVIATVNTVWQRHGKRVHWDAGALIRNARECCKYVTKPGDLLKLTPAALAQLFEIIYRAKLCQPLGSLALEIRTRREAGKCLRRLRDDERKMVWVERRNHNKTARETEEEKAARENLEDAFAFTDECERLAAAVPPSYPGALDGANPTRTAKTGAAARVMARIMPAAGPTPIKEPRVIVLCPDGRFDLRSVQGHPLTVSLWRETVQAWEAARVGIRSVTVSVTESTPAHQLVTDLDAAAILADPSAPPDPIFAPPRAFATSANA